MLNEGRSQLNVSEWNRPQDGAGDVVEQILDGGMPPSYYTWMHSSAKLSAAEKQALARGWQATMRSPRRSPGGSRPARMARAEQRGLLSCDLTW